MSDTLRVPDRYAGLGRGIEQLCRLFAIGGGLVLAAFALMTVVSVTGRYLFDRPVPGDFELVEIGCAIAVFAFLPYCQLQRGNVVVDFFTLRAPAAVRERLDALGSLLYALIAALLAWRLTLGGYDMWRYGEETMVLGLSRWWGFIPIVISCLLLVVACLYRTGHAWRQARSGDAEGAATARKEVDHG